jgi:hypothetical protein
LSTTHRGRKLDIRTGSIIEFKKKGFAGAKRASREKPGHWLDSACHDPETVAKGRLREDVAICFFSIRI